MEGPAEALGAAVGLGAGDAGDTDGLGSVEGAGDGSAVA